MLQIYFPLKRTLFSGAVFYVVFLAFLIALQYGDPGFSLTSAALRTVFVTILYLLFTAVLRRWIARNEEKDG